ncbi:cation:proton antiporter [Sphingomonas sp.]|uniref:cation:proton antiporter domain-containing protein n=1 Tax=Sphingomonas sp. TaxID=28214 RepID=UPI0025F7BEC7|nr:cation:proton antiporter [Sphingomonas sp.]
MSTGTLSAAASDALVILGAAGIVIPAFARFRITPIIGFILVGILVGPFGLGALDGRFPWLFYFSITDPHAVEPFAELGIILLLFSIGLELSFRRLWLMRRRVIGFGATQLIGSATLIACILLITREPGDAALGLGVALALSSTALVLPMAGTTSAVGKLAFAMLLFQDLALVPIVFTLGALGGSAAGFDGVMRLLIGGGATVGAMLIAGPFVLSRLFAQAARTKTPELFLSASLLVVILASVATVSVGLSPIVGALVAGLLIAETDYAHEVESVVAPFRGLALGIFLITVGMSLNLPMVLARWPALLAAITGVVVIKAVVTTLALRVGGVRGGVAVETGVLMASPSETTLIVLGAAATAGLIAPDAAAFWQVVTAIGLTITPLLAWGGHEFARRTEWRDVPAASAEPVAASGTIIIGYGRVGEMVAAMLDRHNLPWLAVEADVDIITTARRAGKQVRFGDAGREGVLEALGIESASALVMTMDDPVQAVRLVRRLSKAHPDLTIVARARDPEHAGELYRAGCTDAVPETLESSLQLSEAVLVDLGVAMGPVIASIHEKRDELRAQIKDSGHLDVLPRLGSLRARSC